MPSLPKNLNPRVTLALALYLLSSLLVLGLLLNVQLSQLGSDQQSALGKALGTQLAESVKQPLIDRNPISMQVILDNLLSDTESVVRATLYSPSNQILAQSQRRAPAGAGLSAHTKPVIVDNTLLGQVRIELDRADFINDYRIPALTALGVWLLLSAPFAAWLWRTAANYSRRIETLNGHLHASDGNRSELETLELALAPFHKATDGAEEDPTRFHMLAVNIPNLPRWRAQFSAETFADMMEKVDDLIDAHLQLFGGRRLQGRHNAMILLFDGSNEQDSMAWVIHCANALIKMGTRLAHNENLPLELHLAAASRRPAAMGSPWCVELEREDCIERLMELAPLAGPWELIIDRTELVADELEGCHLEAFSAEDAWQFQGYSGEHQAVFDQQVAFLEANLA